MIGPPSYIGEKRSLAKRIIAIFPEHTTYVEAFAGGAQVFFHKGPSKVEVLNDLDGEIVNFFRVCQLHHEELLRYFRFCLVSRRWFELFKAMDPATLTDVQRAARYLYLLKGSFASLVRHPNYHWHVIQPPGFNLERLPELIENAHKVVVPVMVVGCARVWRDARLAEIRYMTVSESVMGMSAARDRPCRSGVSERHFRQRLLPRPSTRRQCR
jgi:D12 class N6 adenine-specific DNA methyltransferase